MKMFGMNLLNRAALTARSFDGIRIEQMDLRQVNEKDESSPLWNRFCPTLDMAALPRHDVIVNEAHVT